MEHRIELSKEQVATLMALGANERTASERLRYYSTAIVDGEGLGGAQVIGIEDDKLIVRTEDEDDA